MGEARIILVYNADTGLGPMVWDWLVKHLAPARYSCRLCALTYGMFTMKRGWAETLVALPVPYVALHRDEWRAQFPGHRAALPAILWQEAETLRVLVSAADFDALDTLAALQALLAERLAAADPAGGRGLPGGQSSLCWQQPTRRVAHEHRQGRH